MPTQGSCWKAWRAFFARRSGRPIPELDDGSLYADLPPSLARSLAIFQLGESGGGTVIAQARSSRLRGIDADYAEAMALFVAEEHRHADILAVCVRQLGGELIHDNWTARLFVAARRLIGLRMKVLVLLAAEVVGICYYHFLARALAGTPMSAWLAELVEDEQSHLDFHCYFLRSQTRQIWQRWAFVATWRVTMLLAAVAVLVDHRAAIRDLRLSRRAIWCRWMTYMGHAERLVLADESISAPAVSD